MFSLSGHQPTLATTMKHLTLVSCLMVLSVRADGPTDACIDGVRHQTEVLYNFTSSTWMYSLAVDYKYNFLYLVDSINSVNTAPVILNLNTNEHKIDQLEIEHAVSLSVDQETHDLYIGNTPGIYKYKPSTGTVELVGAAGADIWHVFSKRELYYTDLWSNRVSTLNNGYSYQLGDMQYDVLRLVIDNEDVMFFSNFTGLYSRQMGRYHTTLYYNTSYVYCLALDRNGRVYFASDDGIFEIIKYNASYRKVVAIKEPKAIVFDTNNNIIYCDANKVYRLKPIAEENKTNSCSDCGKQNVDVTNNNINIERKLDSMDKRINKIETDLVKILEGNTNIYKLITDIVKRNEEMEKLDITTVDTVTGQVDEQLHYTVSSPDDSHRY